MPTRVAILDDYQGVALSMADWSSLGPGVSLHPFHERIGSEEELAERLRTFDVIVTMRSGAWQTTVGVGLHGKTLGVIGLGRLGSDVARIGKAFGMNVIAWSQNLTREKTDPLDVELVDKVSLFRRSDIATVHLVLSDRTRGIVGERELTTMKPTAFLINTARGPVVAEHALIHALRHSVIAGAGLDVFDEEPLPADHPLRRLENVVLTPHLGYVTAENYRLAYGEAVEDVRAFLAGAPVRVIA